MKIDRDKLVKIIEERGRMVEEGMKRFSPNDDIDLELELDFDFNHDTTEIVAKVKAGGDKVYLYFDSRDGYFYAGGAFTYEEICDRKQAFEAVHAACRELGVVV